MSSIVTGFGWQYSLRLDVLEESHDSRSQLGVSERPCPREGKAQTGPTIARNAEKGSAITFPVTGMLVLVLVLLLLKQKWLD